MDDRINVIKSSYSGPVSYSSYSYANEKTSFDNIDLKTNLNTAEHHSTESKPQPPSWGDLFSFTTPGHYVVLSIAVFSTTCAAALQTALSVVLGLIFQAVTQFGSQELGADETLSQVSKWCLALCFMAAGAAVANMSALSSWTVFGELQAKSARTQMLEGLLGKEMEWFDTRRNGISSLLARIQTQTRELQTATSQALGLSLSDLLIAISSAIVAFVYSWRLTLVLLASVPVSLFILSLITRRLDPAVQELNGDLAEASKYTSAALAAIDTVKLYNGFDHEVWQYMGAIKMSLKHFLTQAQCTAGQEGYTKLWTVGLFVIGFWYGIDLVNKGSKPGAILTTFYSTLTGLQSIEAILPQWLVMNKGFHAGRSLKDTIFNYQNGQHVEKMRGQQWPPYCRGKVDLNGVSFAYPSNPENLVLRSSSFHFATGTISFVVGHSGSGKSTIGNLLAKFYEPTTGDILIDGVPIQSLHVEWLRNAIMLLQQSSILFNDTLFMNVALGHRHPKSIARHHVNGACDGALLQATIASLPHGLDTFVGQGGASLSRGQMQRIALARAKLRDPPVLILDEVTSGLDPVTKSLAMEAVRHWRQGKTTIIITHDVSQIGDNDFVYVMDQGAVVQEGRRFQIEDDSKGLFASLVASSGKKDITLNSSPLSSLPRPRFQHDAIMQKDTKRNSRLFSMLLNQDDVTDKSKSHRVSLGIGTAPPYAQLMQPKPTKTGGMSKRSIEHGLLARKSLRERGISFQSPSGAQLARARKTISPISHRRNTRDNMAFVRHMGGDIQRRGRSRAGTPKMSTRGINVHVPSGERLTGSQKFDAMSLTDILKTVWPNLSKRYCLLLLVGLASCLAVAVAIPAFSYIFARLLACFWIPESESDSRGVEARKWALLLGLVGLIDMISTFLSHYCLEHTAYAWINALRMEAFKRMLKQPKEWHDRAENQGDRLTEALDREAEEMRSLLGRFARTIFIVCFMIASSVVWALVVSYKLTLVTIGAGLVVVGVTRAFAKVSSKWEAKCSEAAGFSSSVLSEIIVNIRVVRALTLEKFFSAKYSSETKKTFFLGVNRAIRSGPFYGLSQSANFWMMALVFYYGTRLLTVSKEVATNEVMQVINLLVFSVGTATAMMGNIPQIAAARVAGASLIRLSKMRVEGQNYESGGLRRVDSPLPIRLREVQFAYPSRPDTIVLRNLSLTIRAGETVAVVGESGCGKSTLASLLLRLYAPHSSTGDQIPSSAHYYGGKHNLALPSPITYGTISATACDTKRLRELIALVPQHLFLFPASLAENIAYGLLSQSPLRSSTNILDAACRAGLHELALSLPHGYDTRLGEGGVMLSGGQMQRVGIARALARGAKVLVLDEPTASLDAQGAREVREMIVNLIRDGRRVEYTDPQHGARRNSRGVSAWEPVRETASGRSRGPDGEMAVVIVTHCRQMMKAVDRVIMLDEGMVAEEGSHDELVARGGKFARFVGVDRGM